MQALTAKDEKTQHTLRDNWHDIVYDRRYVTIVTGDMEKDQGKVESWLTDRKLYVSSSPVDDGGKFSVTHYRTIKRANGFSLVELQLVMYAEQEIATVNLVAAEDIKVNPFTQQQNHRPTRGFPDSKIARRQILTLK